MSAPSVLFINRVYPPAHGATGRVLRDLARAFAEQGWTVTVLTTGERAGQDKDQGVLIRRVKAPQILKPGFAYLWVWLKLWFAGRRMMRRDLVVTLSDPPMIVLAGRSIARKNGSDHIHWCHDIYPDLFAPLGFDMPGWFFKSLKKRSRRAMKSCSRVIVVGRCMAKTLTHSGVETARVSVVPNWPPPELYIPTEAQKAGAAPDHLKRDDSPKFRVMYAGNLGRAHPIAPILDAAEQLKSHPEIELVFVGDSPGHERLAEQRDKRGLTNIKFVPYQPITHLRAALMRADVHLVTMRDETAGLLVPCKFYSALAVGRPVIYLGPEDTEIHRILKDFGAGLWIKSGQSAALAKAILDLRHNGELWSQLQAGAEQAGEVLTPHAAIASWVKRAS